MREKLTTWVAEDSHIYFVLDLIIMQEMFTFIFFFSQNRRIHKKYKIKWNNTHSEGANQNENNWIENYKM